MDNVGNRLVGISGRVVDKLVERSTRDGQLLVCTLVICPSISVHHDR